MLFSSPSLLQLQKTKHNTNDTKNNVTFLYVFIILINSFVTHKQVLKLNGKRGISSLLVPLIEAFALPRIVERATSKPTPIWIHFSLYRYKTPCITQCAIPIKGCGYTHPEGIHRCNVRDNPWSLRSFSSSRTKRQVNAFYYVMIPLPSQVLVSTISLFWERKHQLGVSRMGICVQRYIKYLKCLSFSRNFFRKKSKKDRCGGTHEREQMFENKERAEKQLLTVNSVNPSCSSALKIYSITFPLKKKITSASIPKQELYAPSSHPR